MVKIFQQLWRLGERQALGLLAGGLALAAWRSWQQWQRDKGELVGRPLRVAAPDAGAWPRQPSVSVIVAAWNEADNIEAHLRSFRALSYPDKELVLCAGGKDGTYELARRFDALDIVVLEQRPGEGKQGALRRCLEHATGEIIYLTDADCELSDAAFLHLLQPLVLEGAAVATGSLEPKAEQRGNSLVRYQWLIDLAWSQRLPTTTDGVRGCNCAIHRSTLEHIGGFTADVSTGTDYYMSQRLRGAQIAIRAVRDSAVATEYADTSGRYLRMWRRWNKNLLLHGVRFGAWGDVRSVLTASAIYGSTWALLLLSPLLGRLPLSLGIWLFGIATMNRLRQLALGAQIARTPLTGRMVAQTIGATALDMGAVLLALWDAASPVGRRRW